MLFPNSVFYGHGDAPAYFLSQLDSHVVPCAGCLNGNGVEQVSVAQIGIALVQLILCCAVSCCTLLLFFFYYDTPFIIKQHRQSKTRYYYYYYYYY